MMFLYTDTQPEISDLLIFSNSMDSRRALLESDWYKSLLEKQTVTEKSDVYGKLGKQFCDDDRKICTEAAIFGNLDLLKYLRNQGVPWDKNVCEVAALGGHLELLQWALENRCECDLGYVCVRAAEGGQLEVLKWLVETLKAPCDPRALDIAQRGGHSDVVEWFREKKWFREKMDKYDPLRCNIKPITSYK